MKTIIRNTALILFLTLGLQTQAAEFAVSVKTGYTIKVSADNLSSNATIYLRDLHGVLLYSQELDKRSKTISFENLPDGMYTLLMENDLMYETTRIIKNNSGLSVEDVKDGMVFKPSFKVADKKVRISLTNPTKQEVLFKVYDNKGIQVASVTSNDLVIKRSFDFEGGKPGAYTFVTELKEQSFSKEISVN